MRDEDNRVTPLFRVTPPFETLRERWILEQLQRFEHWSCLLPPERPLQGPYSLDFVAAWKSLKAAGSCLRSPFTLRWCILTAVYIAIGCVIGWFARF